MTPEDLTKDLVDYVSTMSGPEALGALSCVAINISDHVANPAHSHEQCRHVSAFGMAAINGLLHRISQLGGARTVEHTSCDEFLGYMNTTHRRLIEAARKANP